MNFTINDLKVLSVLVSGDKYGLEIVQEVSETGTTLLLGSLYNVLKKLENNGFVKSYWGDEVDERGGNRRKYYKITAKGQNAVEENQRAFGLMWGIQFS
ncbi:MAG: PadR family transcriptional regulator [Saprospiraceae bacterium]|nr:PadR family transcriptional regulator [Lewinella sp.]